MAVKEKRRRSRSRKTDTSAAIAAPAYITRKIPYYEYMSEEGLQTIEAQVDWLIEDIGMEFRDDPVALDIWRKAGARVDGTRVRAPAELIRALVAKAPSEFTQVARNPARSVKIGGNHQVFVPVYGPAFVRDLEGGRRYGAIEDYRNLVKLVHNLPALHHGGFLMCEPVDVPVSKRHLDMVYAHLRYSDKPHLGAITEPCRAEDSLAMARIVHGDTMDAHCVIMGNLATNSPLLADRIVTENIRVYCGAGQGVILLPFILSGAMGPVTTAASIAQGIAEVMFCTAFAQIVKPGAPVVFAHFQSSINLRSGAPTFGMPEPVMSHYIVGRLARRLGVPLRAGGSLTSSKVCDAQAAYESADSMHSTAIAGANFVLHAAGWLEGGLCTGYEKLICDAERLDAYQTLLGGVAFDENAMARDAYSEVQPGEHFLGCGHTLRNYKTAFFEARLSDSEPVETWEEQGAQTMEQRAHARWTQMLMDYQEPTLAPDVLDELDEFVARRKAELPDTFA